MARAKTKLEYNTFVKGLITEAGPLTFPDNASLVDTNYVLNRDGSRQRRLGMRYELGNVKKTITSIESTTTAVGSYTWKSVNNKGELDIAVFQLGNKLYFYDNNVNPITGSPLNGGVFIYLGSTTDTKFEFTSAYGKLIIATGEETVYILTYDETFDTISSDTFRLKIRDTFGVEEVPALEIDERSATKSKSHSYNLRNQGWPTSIVCADDDQGGSASTQDPVAYTKTKLGVHPSNADLFSTGKLSSATHIGAINSYSPWELPKFDPGTNYAPRGHYILDLFNRGTDRATHFSGLVNDHSIGGVKTLVSYAGRIFYSVKETSNSDTDDNSPNIGSMIFFSQSTDNVVDFGSCYSKNDPSSEELNDPLATDGGFITIPDIGEIYKLVPLGESLFVIASNGVWEISGGENYFSSTNQSITKTADFGSISSSSTVVGETMISFWSPGGIYAITIGAESLRGEVQNITQNTIQSKYDDIDYTAKLNVIGTYDDISKQFKWLYRSKILPNEYYYDTELVFDLNLKAFYINEIQELTMTSGSSPYVIGYVDLSSSVFTDTSETVEIGTGNTVQVNAVDVISSVRESGQTTQGSTKYWCIRDLGTANAEVTVSGYVDLDFTDWIDEQQTDSSYGKDAEGMLITGYTTDGASESVKKSPYITVFMKRTEIGFTDDGSGNLTPIGESSCIMQGQWEWTDSAAAGRWSSEKEVYRLPRAYVPTGSGDPFDYSFTVVKTKNKVRGKGSSLSLMFKTSPGKDLHLYGWTREVTVPED